MAELVWSTCSLRIRPLFFFFFFVMLCTNVGSRETLDSSDANWVPRTSFRSPINEKGLCKTSRKSCRGSEDHFLHISNHRCGHPNYVAVWPLCGGDYSQLQKGTRYRKVLRSSYLENSCPIGCFCLSSKA